MSYWPARVGDQVVPGVGWIYREPLHDATQTRGLMAISGERVDVIAEGERRERPITPWSPGPRA